MSVSGKHNLSTCLLYTSILNKEEHVKDIDFLTTLEGYVHWKLTGRKVLGIGEAAGMMPVDAATRQYSSRMVKAFDELVAPEGFSWKILDILPEIPVSYTHLAIEKGASHRIFGPGIFIQLAVYGLV